MNVAKIAKTVVKVGAIIGVDTVISDLIEEHLPEIPEENKVSQIVRVIGISVITFVITGLIINELFPPEAASTFTELVE